MQYDNAQKKAKHNKECGSGCKSEYGSHKQPLTSQNIQKTQKYHWGVTLVHLSTFGGTMIEQAGIRLHTIKTDNLIVISLETLLILSLVTLNLAVQMDNVREKSQKCQIGTICRPKMTSPFIVSLSISKEIWEQILKEFSDAFDGIGCLLCEYTINADPNVPWVIFVFVSRVNGTVILWLNTTKT